MTKHIPALDGVRGLAILLVLAHHAGLFPAGWIGVDLFFVLSGFLITGILVREKNGPHYFRTFWWRRVLRIFPAYYLYLGIAATMAVVPLAFWLYLGNVAIARHGWPDAALLLGHLWSVAIEEQFYLVWPVVVYRLAPTQLRRLCVAGIVAALLLRTGSLVLHRQALERYTLTPMRMDALLAGAWLSLTPTLDRRWTLAGVLSLGAGLVVAIVAGAHSPAADTVGATLLAIGFAGVLHACLTMGAAARVFSFGALRSAGKYSYMAYLLHPLVLATLATWARPGLPLMLAGALATFALAWVSWRVIEAPILRLRDRVTPRRVEPERMRDAA